MTEEKNIYKNNEPDYELDTLTNEKLIKDHVYDGIRELDNDLPPWWKWLFYITIIISVIYLNRLFIFEADDLVQLKEYENEMAKAAANAPVEEAFELVLLEDSKSLEAGKEIWDKNCSACHLVSGAGIVGPNITDDYWIHGNTLEEMFHIVEVGVIEKGMIAYKDQFTAKQRLEVISYMISLHGSNPANPKAPEGEELPWPY